MESGEIQQAKSISNHYKIVRNLCVEENEITSIFYSLKRKKRNWWILNYIDIDFYTNFNDCLENMKKLIKEDNTQ